MTRAIPVLLLLTLTSLAVAAEEDQDAHDHDAHQSQETTEGHDDRGSHDDHGHGEGAVHLDDALIAELGLTVAPAGAGEISHRVHVPGEVRPNRNRLAHLVPRFGGVVAEVRAFEGDRVAAGDVLARVEANESLVEFDVRSLIAGTVIERHATLGEAVSPDRNMFVVADLDTLWVELAIPQRDLGSIRVGQTVRLRVGHDVQPDAARIDYLAPVVDAVTRTGTARVVVANPDGRWSPGTFVTADVIVDRQSVPLAVPRSALHRHDGGIVVFVRDGDAFRATPVRVGREGDDHVEIVEGLVAGQAIVASGGFVLKAELEKSSFGHGHAH